MSVPPTPQRVNNLIEDFVGKLNSCWDLQLPLIYGIAARTPEDTEISVKRKCFSQIRLLCWRSEETLDVIYGEFEEKAKQILSKWVFKPSQELGTSPSLPRTKSFLYNGKSLSDKERDELCRTLLEVMHDPVELCKGSDSFKYEIVEPKLKTSGSINRGLRSTKSPAQNDSLRREKCKASDGGHGSSEQAENHTTGPAGLLSKRGSIESYFIPSSPETTWTKSGTIMFQSAHSFDTNRSASPRRGFSPPQDDEVSSNATSILSNTERPSQAMLSTQECDAIMQDPETASPLFHSFSTPKTLRWEDLRKTGIVNLPASSLSHALPFWYRFEILRIAVTFGISEICVLKDIENFCRTKTDKVQPGPVPSESMLWEFARTHLKKEMALKTFVKSEWAPWDLRSNKYEDAATSKSMQFSVSLDWAKSFSKHPFEVMVDPMHVENSCRAHRKYGADRFMTVKLPYFDLKSIPKHLCGTNQQAAELEGIIYDWLARGEHQISGRRWRAFFVEPIKAKSGQKKEDFEIPMQKIHMFAVDGIDFASPHNISRPQSIASPRQKISLQEFINWHIPIKYNLDSTDLKLFSRFSLALSKTIATVVLERDEFLFLRDMPGETVMNEGCALMSHKLATKIAEMIGLWEVPSAFQGRIAGSKGVWMVDSKETHEDKSRRGLGYWIEVSDSQLKVKPHPRRRHDADEFQRQFEVLKYSKPPRPASLNNQLITILCDRGVDTQILEDIVRNDMGQYSDIFFAATESCEDLRAWMQRYHFVPRNPEPLKFRGALPDSLEEQINFLLESGFKPEACGFLSQKIYELMNTKLKRYVDRLQITLPKSAYLICIADPYGVLEEGQLHLGFSESWLDSETRVRERELCDMEVLVSRLPALLASDIQKVRAVYHPVLRRFRDVVVFPSKGKQPLASMLSGGDYDGDIMWVCWEQSIVSRFKNVRVPDLPEVEECGIVRRSVPLSKYFQSKTIEDADMEDFLLSSFRFNCQQSLLAPCSLEHEKFIYHGRGDLLHPGALQYAATAAYLVDGAKQGYELNTEEWQKIRSRISGKQALSKTRYRGGPTPPLQAPRHIIDHIKYGVAETEMHAILTKMSSKFLNTKIISVDPCLSARASALTRTTPRNCPESEALRIIVKTLKDDLGKLLDEWEIANSRKHGGQPGRPFDAKHYRQIAEDHHSKFLAIKPAAVEHDIYRKFKEQEHDMNVAHTEWIKLKASMFYLTKKHSCVWHVAGRYLCQIKAEACPSTRTMTATMYNILKIDLRLQERVQKAGNSVEDEIDDTLTELAFLDDWTEK